MTNTVILLTVSAWCIALAVLGEREKYRALSRRCDLITALSGIAAAVLCAVIAYFSIKSTHSEEFIGWAYDILKTYYITAFAVFGLLFTMCAVTSLVSRRNPKLRAGLSHKLRVIMTAVSSVFILSVSYLGYIASNDRVPLDILIFISGAGISCIMRFCSLIENGGM